MVSWPSVKD